MSGITLSIKICKSSRSSMKDSLLHFVLISLSLFIAWSENYIKYNTIILMDIISLLKRSTGEHKHTHTKQDLHSSGQGGRRIRSLAERWVIQERDRTLRLWSPARPLWTYIIFFKDLSLMLAHRTHACSVGLITQMWEDHNPIHGQINERKLYLCRWAVSP